MHPILLYAHVVKSKIDDPLKKLRDQLITLQSIPSETEEAKQSKITMAQNALKAFITTSMDLGIDAHTIQDILEALHTKDTDLVIDGEVYHWCIAEIKKQNTIRNPELGSEELIPEVPPLNEVNFGEVTVQNSLLACHLLNCPDSKHRNSLHEVNRSKFLSLVGKEEKSCQTNNDHLMESSCVLYNDKESSTEDSRQASAEDDRDMPWPLLSQREIHSNPVHQYLIAKGVTQPDGHVIYYMAFGSHQNLKEWSYGHHSFEDGMLKYVLVHVQ